jgi:hypothetical protein
MAIESSAGWAYGALKFKITCRLRDDMVPAGGPVVGEIRFTNQSTSPGSFVTASELGRPAYLKFTGELVQPHLTFRDPLEKVLASPEGPIATIEVPAAETREVRVVVNQFLCLEDARAVLSPGTKALMRIGWRRQMAEIATAERRIGHEFVGGWLELEVLRDDELLRTSITALAERLEKDRNVIAADPVGRREASLALASLRVPEAIEALRRLTSHPDLEVRMRAEQALLTGDR